VRAYTDIDSLAPRLGDVVGDHIRQLFPRPEPVPDAGPGQSDSPDAERGPSAEAPPANVVALPSAPSASPEEPPWDLLATCRLDPERSPGRNLVRVSVERVSTTDADAIAMRTATGG